MKKKRNYYNLIVYASRLFIISGFIFLMLFSLGNMESVSWLKKYEILLLIMSFACVFDFFPQ